jgi:hypothetical protein
MARLMIEYTVDDWAGWKAMFEQDPLRRESLGALGHEIFQVTDDPRRFLLAIDFDTVDHALAFRKLAQTLATWPRSGAGQSWILERSERKTYQGTFL